MTASVTRCARRAGAAREARRVPAPDHCGQPPRGAWRCVRRVPGHALRWPQVRPRRDRARRVRRAVGVARPLRGMARWKAPNLGLERPADAPGRTSPTSSTATRRNGCGWPASPAPTARRRARSGSRRRSTRAAAAPRSLGTLGNGLVGGLAPATHTTPDVTVLQEMLTQFHAAGARAVAMEVSSHGLEQGRVNGVKFDIALFTNLTRDHLDYHKTMAAYGAAKAKLFTWPGLRTAVINADDAFGQSLIDAARARGAAPPHVRLRQCRHRRHARSRWTGAASCSRSTTPWGKAALASPVVGAFNAQNLLGVLGVLLASDVPLARRARRRSAQLPPPAGRMQRLGGDGKPLVVVDYAHTPDALEKVLQALRPAVAERRRTRLRVRLRRRSRSGQATADGRDRRARSPTASSSPATIRAARIRRSSPTRSSRACARRPIAAGRSSTIAATAIRGAIAAAKAGDIVLIAGKGHETYQERDGVRTPFSDARSNRGGARGMERRMMDTATAARVVDGRLVGANVALPAGDDRQPRAARRRPLRRAEGRTLRRPRLRAAQRSRRAPWRRWWRTIARTALPGALIAVADPLAALGTLAAYWRARFALPLVADRRQQRQDHGQGNARGDPARGIRRGERARDARQPQQRDRPAADAAAPRRRASRRRHRARHEPSRRDARAGRDRAADDRRRQQRAARAPGVHGERGRSGRRARGRDRRTCRAAAWRCVNADDAHAERLAGRGAGARARASSTFGARSHAPTCAPRCTPRDGGSDLELATPAGAVHGRARGAGPAHGAQRAGRDGGGARVRRFAGRGRARTRRVSCRARPAGRGARATSGALVLDDTYNANPDSVRAAIDVLARTAGNALAGAGRHG